MPDFSEEIGRLREAIALGVSEVTYNTGRRVKYSSVSELLAALRYLEGQDTSMAASAGRAHTSVAAFDRGDC